MRRKWSNEKSKAIVGQVTGCLVTNVFDNEDYTTEQLVVSVEKSTNRLLIRGFRIDGVTPSDKDPFVDMVEVNTGFPRGVTPDDDLFLDVHKKVKKAFEYEDYMVVDHIEAYV